MSDECLMTLETVFPFYVVYQAVMRKFTLARKSICRFVYPRTPLSRCSSEGLQPGTRTKGSQNLYCYIPSLSFFERAPLGYATCSVIDFVASLVEEGLKKNIIFPIHTQDVKIDSLPLFCIFIEIVNNKSHILYFHLDKMLYHLFSQFLVNLHLLSIQFSQHLIYLIGII